MHSVALPPEHTSPYCSYAILSRDLNSMATHITILHRLIAAITIKAKACDV